jgi:hypothetical protein
MKVRNLASMLSIVALTFTIGAAAQPANRKAANRKPANSRASGDNAKTRVWNDSTRLEAILTDVNNPRVNPDSQTWQRVSRESTTLADRAYANSSGAGRTHARELRNHVRAMQQEAMKGNRQGMQQHASQALPYAHRLADWSAPADQRQQQHKH